VKGARLVTEISIVRLEPKRDEFVPGVDGFIEYMRVRGAWRDMRAAVGARLFHEQFMKAVRRAS
jgi:hypothetical protein